MSLLAIFIAMAVIVATSSSGLFTQPMDDAWRKIIGASPDAALYTQPFAMFFQLLGEGPGGVLGLFLVPLALVVVGRWRSALFFLSAMVTGPILFSQVTKNTVDRPRPAIDEAAGLFGPLFTVDHGSFPSGHVVIAATLTVSITALIPPSRVWVRRWWCLIATFTVLGMIWQRTLINAHWLSDTVFGAIAGVSAALLMWWAFWPLIQRDYGRPLWWRRGSRWAAHVDGAAE